MAIKKPLALYNGIISELKKSDQFQGTLNSWKSNFDYFKDKSFVIYDYAIYICKEDHVSNQNFEFDLNHNKWEELKINVDAISFDSSNFHLVLKPNDDTLDKVFSRIDTVIDDDTKVLDKTWSSDKINKEIIKKSLIL